MIEHPANLFVDARGLHGSDPCCALGGSASDPEINIDSLRAKLLRENFSNVRDRVRVELIRFGVGAPRVDRVGCELAFVARNLLFAPRGRARGIRKKRGGRVQFDMRNALRHQGTRRIFRQGFEARTAADLDGIGSLAQKKIALALEVDIVVILSDRGRQMRIRVEVGQRSVGGKDLGDRGRGVGAICVVLVESVPASRINDHCPRVPAAFLCGGNARCPCFFELAARGGLTIPLSLWNIQCRSGHS